MNKFPVYKQLNAMDCGPTCLRMVARHYGRHYNTDSLRQLTGYSKQGVSLLGICEAAEKLGFRTRGVQLTVDQLLADARRPCILHWNENHFVVFPPSPLKVIGRKKIPIADPAKGLLHYSAKDFQTHWIKSESVEGEKLGIALLLDPGANFYLETGEADTRIGWMTVIRYLRSCKWELSQVFIAFLVTSLLQLILPFLTQGIVDNGINSQNLNYITIVLLAQLMLTFSQTIVDFIRSRLLQRVSIIINLSILSDFWIKLTRLPLSYFDSHRTGDTIQRISDNKQIQSFLTGNAISTLFSFFNLIIYGFVLLSYSAQLFFTFSIGSVLYFVWIRFFLSLRKKINTQTFRISARENSATLQLVQGMQEIRLQNAERIKRWEWENIQAGIFKLNFKTLTYNQIQQAGALLINQTKNIVLTFLAASLVIEGKLTLGTMLAIQYIIGQLGGPVEQFVSFIQSAQDARMSLDRLNEIHQMKDEEDHSQTFNRHLPQDKSIRFQNLTFRYPGGGNDLVLDNINLEIPEGKVTAIVGVSGSGKTTLLKLLLRFYETYGGTISVGDTNLKYISPSYWRENCGAVTQDGYVFNDSIARNISVGNQQFQHQRLTECCKMANILSFIESLPNGFNTMLGSEGVGLSQGQKQRLLIARAIYKDPEYLLLDEATNALDANNELTIVENLQVFFKGRTVVIVAHRLSTVKNADKIIVLDNGMIAEEGNHETLSRKKGKYFQLVKNQLELGN